MIYLDNDIVISIEDRFTYKNPTGSIQDIIDAKKNAVFLCEMIGKKIVAYENQGSDDVCIILDDSSELRLLKLSDPESFNITTQDGVFVS